VDVSDLVVAAALRAYPRWWRDRYGDEQRAVVDDLRADGRSTWWIGADLARGALRARAVATGMPPEESLWRARLRTSVVTATLPLLLAVPIAAFVLGGWQLHWNGGTAFLGGFAFSGLGHVSGITAGPLPQSGPPTVSLSLGPASWVALDACFVLGLLALVAFFVLADGWSTLRWSLRAAGASKRLRLLAWAPAISLGADLALVVTEAILRPHRWVTHGGPPVPLDGHLAAANLVARTFQVVAVVGWPVAVACVGVAASRAELPVGSLAMGARTSLAASVLTGLTALAVVTWGVALLVQEHLAATAVTVSSPHGVAALVVAPLLVGVAVVSALATAAARGAAGVLRPAGR
jgi:hypothetical protein